MKPSNTSLCSLPNVCIFEKCDKHSCSATAIINLSMDQPIVFCIVRPILLWLCGQPLYFLLRLQPLFLASLGFAAHHSHVRVLPSLNLKKMRDCSQSRIGLIMWQPVEPNDDINYNRLSPSKKDKIWTNTKSFCGVIVPISTWNFDL